jgi:ribosomal protein S27AE
MKNERDIAACGTCPRCAGKQKVVTLSDFLEWSEEQEAWVPLTVSICDTCGHTTIHAFHPEMFTTLPMKDKNEELASQGDRVMGAIR